MLQYYDIYFKEQNLWIQMEYCELVKYYYINIIL